MANSIRNNSDSAQTPYEILRDFYQRLWSTTVDMIGGSATETIFQSALREAGQTRPVLAGARISREGMELPQLPAGQSDAVETMHAYAHLNNVPYSLLQELTGGVVSERIGPLMEQFGAANKP